MKKLISRNYVSQQSIRYNKVEKRMKAAVLVDKMKMEIQELPVPTPTEHEVLVKVKACAICGTDQHSYHGQHGSDVVQHRFVVAHAWAAEVVYVGEIVYAL